MKFKGGGFLAVLLAANETCGYHYKVADALESRKVMPPEVLERLFGGLVEETRKCMDCGAGIRQAAEIEHTRLTERGN